MKRTLFVLIPIVVVCFCLMLVNLQLGIVLRGDNENIDGAYACANLGFVLEEWQNVCNSIKYTKDGDVVGECVVMHGVKKDLNKICDKIGMVVNNKYCVNEIYMVEGYSPLFKYYSSGQQNNIQIAVMGDSIVVGSPIIYGSF